MSYPNVNLDAFFWEQCQRSPLWVPAEMDETPASTYCTSAGTTFEPPSIEELQAIMDRFPRPEHDVVVTTMAIWERLLKSPEVVAERKSEAWNGMGLDRLLGLPVEVYPSDVAAYLRADKLRQEGQRVMLVLEKSEESPNPPLPAANTLPENSQAEVSDVNFAMGDSEAGDALRCLGPDDSVACGVPDGTGRQDGAVGLPGPL